MCKNDDKNTTRYGEENVSALLSLIREGKVSAFSDLIQTYQSLLHARISAFHLEGQGADDAYSEACLALYRAALRYREGMGVTFGLFAKICIDNALKTDYKKNRLGTASDGCVDLVPLEAADAAGLVAEFSDPVVEERRCPLSSRRSWESCLRMRKRFSHYIT